MSDHGAPKLRDDSPEPSNTKTPRSPLNFEFIDSQHPNTKSQIQSHTARHAVQQRREAARQRLQRETSSSRVLEWQRRSNIDEDTSTSSASPTTPSISIIPGSKVLKETVQRNDLTSPPSEDPVIRAYTDDEDALLQHYASTRCNKRSHANYFSRLVERVRHEPSAAYLIMAYAAAHRAESGISYKTRNSGLAADYKTKCLTLLNDRIMTANGIHKASDKNIQAILFLLAYETRYGNTQEADLHLNGLRIMIQERGGLRAFGQQITLRQQLLWVELTGTTTMILECAPDCRGLSTLPLATGYTFKRISLADPGPRHDVAQSFIHRLGQFCSHEHVSVLRAGFVPFVVLHQFTLANLKSIQTPASSWRTVLTDCRIACLIYINALILTAENSDQKAKDFFDDTIIQHFDVNYPTGESPFGLLWDLVHSLQLNDERKSEALWMVIDMMQALRLLRPERLDMVENVLLQILFYPHHVMDASLDLNETEILNDIVRQEDYSAGN